MASISIPASRSGRRQAPLGARLRARLMPGRLDRELAAGADPRRSPALATRAERIVSPHFRRVIALGFDRIVEAAAEPRAALTPVAPLRREAVLDAAPELAMLATLLRHVEAAAPCGVAQAWSLLTDGAGPLYFDSGDDCIRRAARAAAEAL